MPDPTFFINCLGICAILFSITHCLRLLGFTKQGFKSLQKPSKAHNTVSPQLPQQNVNEMLGGHLDAVLKPMIRSNSDAKLSKQMYNGGHSNAAGYVLNKTKHNKRK